MKSEDRVPFGIGSGLAMLANLIVVIQYAGKHTALAVLAVLGLWVLAIVHGRKILRWLARYRRDLLFLLLGGTLASGRGPNPPGPVRRSPRRRPVRM
jgi:hypothetical protein